jgi:hypothetical protein
MAAIGDAIPFSVLFSRDIKVSLMSLQVLLTLQIPISSGDIMETHRSVMLPIALGAANDFQAFLANSL